MNKCYIINRNFKIGNVEDSEVIGVCLNIKDNNLSIEENKNLRWIKNPYKISYTDWLSKDKSTYDIYINIEFYGDVNLSKCNVIKDISNNYRCSFDNKLFPEKFIGVYTNQEGYEILKKNYENHRWKKYISIKSNKEFKNFEEATLWFNEHKSYHIEDFDTFNSQNPLSFVIFQNVPLKV